MAARIVLIEAPSGAGKSTLVDHLAAAHDGPVLRATLTGTSATPGQLRSRLEASLSRLGLSDLLGTLVRGDEHDLVDVSQRWAASRRERLLLVVDDLHLAGSDLAQHLAEMCDRWPRPQGILLAGRRIPDPVRRLLSEADSHLVVSEDLHFRPDETRELLGPALAGMLDDAHIDLITRRCGGWAAAVGLAGERLRRVAGDRELVASVAAELASRPSTVHDLVRALVRDVPSAERNAIGRLARLPAFDDHLARAAGLDGGLAGLANLGLPLEDAGHGMRGLPNVVRELLEASEPDESLVRAAARHYLELAMPQAALEVLAAAGLEGDLAEVLYDFPDHLFGHIDAREFAAAVAAVPHHLLVAHPAILVHLADRLTLAGQIPEYAAAIARAEALLIEGGRGEDDHDPEVLTVRAAVLGRRAVAGNDDGLVDEAEALLADPGLPPRATARLTVAVARSIASRRTAPALRAGARHFAEAVQIFERVGAPIHAIGTRVLAATFALLPLGRYEDALREYDHALSVARGNLTLRVAILPYRAFALIDLGRYAEAEAHLRELQHTATTGAGGNDRAAVYARWAAARMASQRGDADATWAAIHAVESSDAAVDTGGGAFFRADAAQLLARVGEMDEAERVLAGARDRDTGRTALVTFAEFVVAAHGGDRRRAEAALDRLAGGEAVEPRDRWRISLLHAQVCHRDGDPSASRLAAAAFEEAAQLGHPDLPFVREPDVAQALLAIASASSASARQVAVPRNARIRLLGGFEVEVAGTRSEPVGRPAQLLAFLVLQGGRATVDALIDVLWPDVDSPRGRERLRTVLRRVRRDHGDLVERHDDLLRLRSDLSVDVYDFEGFCRQAMDPATDREAAAAAALAVYGGAPAPSLGHLDFVAGWRDRLEAQVLAMHDVVAEQATEDGRLDEAIRALLSALQLEPVAESRYLAAARLLAEQGRRTRARRLLAAGRAQLIDASLEPGPEFDRFEAYLARNPAVAVTEVSA